MIPLPPFPADILDDGLAPPPAGPWGARLAMIAGCLVVGWVVRELWRWRRCTPG